MQAIEGPLQAAEARFEKEREDLILSQANEMQEIHARHHQEHETLLEKTVKSIVSKIL